VKNTGWGNLSLQPAFFWEKLTLHKSSYGIIKGTIKGGYYEQENYRIISTGRNMGSVGGSC
jgi:hypothetical protein